MNAIPTKLVLITAHLLLFTSGPTSVVIGFRSVSEEWTTGDEPTNRLSGSISHGNCRCVPDQWEGFLVSVEREFEAHDGSQPFSVESRVSVHYDYVNERFAMNDVDSGRRTVADYKQGYKYIIQKNRCVRIRTDNRMPQMCLPAEADYVGNFLIGTDVEVGIWQFFSSANLSTRTTVMTKNCVPISEEIFMVERAFSALTTSQYIDVTLGIQNEAAFAAPSSCQKPIRVLSPHPVDIVSTQQQQQLLDGDEKAVGKRSASKDAAISTFAQLIFDQLK